MMTDKERAEFERIKRLATEAIKLSEVVCGLAIQATNQSAHAHNAFIGQQDKVRAIKKELEK